MYVCIHACMHACMYVCMHACMYACMYECLLFVGLSVCLSVGMSLLFSHSFTISLYLCLLVSPSISCYVCVRECVFHCDTCHYLENYCRSLPSGTVRVAWNVGDNQHEAPQLDREKLHWVDSHVELVVVERGSERIVLPSHLLWRYAKIINF